MDWRSNNFFFLDGDLTSAELSDALENFKGTMTSYASYGVNTISLTWFNPVDTETAEILDKYTPEFPEYMRSLPNDEVLLAFTEAAHDRGFKVIWKPHFEADSSVTGSSGNVNPYYSGTDFDADTFLSNVNEYWRSLAPLAETANVDLLVVGTEHEGFAGPSYDSEWRKIFATVRDDFSGKLTYDALSYLGRSANSADDITFWDALDYIGISMYLPLAEGEPSVEGAYETLRNNWIVDWQIEPRINVPEYLEELSLTEGKGIIFTEAGSMAREGVLTSHATSGALDFWEQTVRFGVLLDEFSKYDWFQGFNWWNNDTEKMPAIGSSAWQTGWYPFALSEFGFVQKPSGDIVRGFWGDGADGKPLEGELVMGGSGDEVLRGGNFGDLIVAGNGNDRLEGADGGDRLFGGDGMDTLYGGNGNDLLIGATSFNDLADQIFGGNGADSIEGGAGNDNLFGGAGHDKVKGGEGNDWVQGLGGSDYVHGNSGNDTVDGGGGDDTVIGGPGDDRVLGGAGHDELTRRQRQGHAAGRRGDDLFFAQAGDDYVVGGDGIDSVHLGIGSDVYEGNGSGGDIVRGLAGHDTITGGSDGDLLLGHLGLDVINGAGGNDTIRAGIARDIISGGDGDDLLDAAPGWDVLDGGAGNDTLIGSLGNDQMTGGTDADTFVFTARSGWDTVTDYEDGIDILSITYPGRSFDQLVIRTNGDNTTIWYGSGGIILEDTDAAQITADDFLFS